jgi:membrane-associated protease RseP (regulator of RpoE activity)
MEESELKSELRRWRWPHIPLGIVALCTSFLAGIPMAARDPDVATLSTWPPIDTMLGAASYAFGVMLIVVAHELGHYLQCKRHGVGASPPYFIPGIPIPTVGVIPFIGTLGAFIKMELRPVPAKKLLDIGAWGPLAGYIVTVPVLMAGFALSEVRELPADPEAAITLGDSLLLLLGEWLFHPDIPAGHDVYLHPLAMAGWTGCLLTAINLLPIGQLDGGHIAFTTLGKAFNRFAPLLFGILVALGVFGFAGWLVFAILVWMLGIRHPNIVIGDPVPLKRAWLGFASIIMFVTTFSASPIEGMSLLHVLGVW